MTVYYKILIFFSCIIHASVCLSQTKIDSCSLEYFSPTWLDDCHITIKNNIGIVYANCESCKKIILPSDTTQKIINGLTDIFIKKKYPIIVSKTKANDIVFSDYPFLNIKIHYGRKTINKMLLVGTRNERNLYHYSEAFIKLWKIIDKIVREYQHIYNGYELIFYELPF